MSTGATAEQIEEAGQLIGWAIIAKESTYAEIAEQVAAIFCPPTHRAIALDDLKHLWDLAAHGRFNGEEADFFKRTDQLIRGDGT